MTVRELIAKLQELSEADGNTLVLINSYKGGYDNIGEDELKIKYVIKTDNSYKQASWKNGATQRVVVLSAS